MSQSTKKGGLGKGIRALLNNMEQDINEEGSTLPSVAQEGMVNRIARIPIAQIEVNPKQPRHDFDEAALQELAESIKLHDIIQPITLVKVDVDKYQLISGERRWRASQIAGLTDIPAYIRTADGQEMLELALLENLQREDLNPIEIGLSYKRLMEECNLTHEEVADRMKKERSTVTNYIRLLKLPPDIQKAVRDKKISMGHAKAIISIDHADKQLYLFREILQKGLSVRQVEQMVKSLSTDKPSPAIPATAPAKLPAIYKKIEDDMASLFATKVTLDRKKTGKGNIMIEFYSDEDLERIMQKLSL
ncbi:MAG: ParB/RepB/Spo0J family partition protein [Chitinophagia bacterium]|nr:ParB/RepB/Spo0J family partition protein [Chitinophagia bacterium]